MNMICRCLPRRASAAFRAVVVDAGRARPTQLDPTGTASIQKAFRRASRLRWNAIRKMLPDALRVRLDSVNVFSHSMLTGQDPVVAFQSWIDEAMRQLVLGVNGSWTLKFVREAGDHGIARARALLASQVTDAFDPNQPRDKNGKWIVSNSKGETYDVSVDKTDSHWFYYLHKEGKEIGQAIIASPESHTRQVLGTYVGNVEIVAKHRKKGLANALYNEIERHQKIKLVPSPGWQTEAGRKFWEKRKSKIKDAAAPVVHTDRIPTLQSLAVTELQGIIEAVSQKCVRILAEGQLLKRSPAQMARDMQVVIDKTGVARTDMLVSFIVVRAFGAATLDAFRAAHVPLVGTVAERTSRAIPPPPGLVRDAKKKSKAAKAKNLVEVLTAGDDNVCPTCEDISEEGPYTLDEAEKLIPAHPNCRCAFVPWADARFAHDADWDESKHPRDKDGKFTFAGGSGGGNTNENINQFAMSTEAGVISYFKPGEYGPAEVQQSHVFEVNKKAEQDFLQSAKDYDIKLKHEPGLSGITYEAYSVKPDSQTKTHTPNAGINMDLMTKTGEAMGSNEGGVYTGPFGDKYYIKQGESLDHVKNELLAADLYKLAGASTMHYVPVKGDAHVATALEELSKDNIKQFDADQIKAVQKDFAIHAWLANWDAVGTGGDNQVVPVGATHPVTVDVGGSLKYRAQGEPKGSAFGDKVTELFTLRDPSTAPDAAKVFGPMTNEEIKDSIARVTSLSDEKITDAVLKGGGTIEMAKKLIARKNDMAAFADSIATKEPVSSLVEKAIAEIKGEDDPFATKPVFKTKMEHAKWLLMKGTTSEELKKELGWPSIGVPKTAADLNLKLEKTKLGKSFLYKGTPMTAEEIAAAKDKPIAEPVVKPEPAKPTGSHTSFAEELKAKGIATDGVKTNSNNESQWLVSAPVQQANKMAEIASMHPKWKLKEGHKATYVANKSDFPESAATKTLDPNKPSDNFEIMLKEQGVEYNTSKDKSSTLFFVNSNHDVVEQAAKYHPNVQKLSKFEYYAPNEKTASPTLVPIKTPEPKTYTPEELKKAAKTTPLSAQYVPGAPSDSPEANALIQKFNDKWAGKDLTGQQHLLEQKVDEFKVLTEAMKPIAAKTAEQQAANAAAAAAKAAELKAKANLVPDFEDEEDERKYWYQKSINDSSYMSKAQSAMESSKGKKLKAMGLSVTEVAFIKAFTGSYSHVNAGLIKGVMTHEEAAYKAIMKEALDKMEKHDGSEVYRKIQLTDSQRAEYIPGQVKFWGNFSSTSKDKGVWSGDTHFTIKNPKTGVDVEFISSNPSESEVIMPADTYYKVISKTPNQDVYGNTHHGITHIVLEEVVPFAKKKKKAA